MNKRPSADDDSQAEVAIAFRTLTARLIQSRNPTKLRRLVKSSFFQKKQQSEFGSDLISDIRLLVRQVSQSLDVADAPSIWSQWIRYGQTLTDPGVPSLDFSSWADARGLARERTPDSALWMRKNLAAGALYPERSLTRIPPDAAGALDSDDLGGVVASIIADSQRDVINRDRATALPEGFDRILAWVLAGRTASRTGAGRTVCLSRALSLSLESPRDTDKLRLLRWLSIVTPGFDRAILPMAVSVLESIRADGLVPEAIQACARILMASAHESRIADPADLADLVVIANRCVRPDAKSRALCAVSVLAAQADSSGKVISLLEDASRLSAQLTTYNGRNVALIDWFSAAGRSAHAVHPAQLAIDPSLERLIDQELEPGPMAALAGLQLAMGGEDSARHTLSTAVRAAVDSEKMRFLNEVIRELGDILTRPIPAAWYQELDLLFTQLLGEIRDVRVRVGHLVSRLVATPSYVDPVVREILNLDDPSERTELMHRFVEEPIPNAETIVAAVLPSTFTALVQRSQWPQISMLSRIALLSGSLPALAKASATTTAKAPKQASRAVAAALAPVDEASLVRWAGPALDAAPAIPPQTWLASLIGHFPGAAAEGVKSIMTTTPPIGQRSLAVLEGLTLLLEHAQLTGEELAASVAAFQEALGPLPPEATLYSLCRCTRILASLGERERAIRSCHRLLETFRRYPRTALDMHSNGLVRMPTYLAEYWHDQLTHEFLNHPPDSMRMVLNAVSGSHMALSLAPGTLKSATLGHLFLGTANSPTGPGRILAWSWLALVGHRHALSFTMDGREDTIVSHAIAACTLRGDSYPMSDLGTSSRFLAEAAANLFRCGAVDCASALLRQAMDAYPQTSDRDRTPFILAEAWAECFRHRADLALDIRPELERRLMDAGELAPLLVTEARAGVRRWPEVATALGQELLEQITLTYGRDERLPQADELSAVLDAALEHEPAADRLCALVLAYHELADREDVHDRLKSLLPKSL
jgi:hypothetical protein